MSLFTRTASAEDRRAIARSLSGPALLAGVRASVQTGDAQALQLLLDAGRFDIENQIANGLLYVPYEEVLSLHGAPLVDALGEIVAGAELEQAQWPTPIDQHTVSGTVVRLAHRDTLAPVILAVCERFARSFDEIEQQHAPAEPASGVSGSKPPGRESRATLRSDSAVVIAAIGCALDEPRLVRLAQEMNPNCMVRGVKAIGIHDDASAYCHPIALALRYGSVEVLSMEPPWSLETLVWETDTDTDLVSNPFTLLDRQDERPTPQTVSALVPLMLNSPESADMLKDVALGKVFGGEMCWMHLVEPMLQGYPLMLKEWRNSLLQCAFKHAQPWLFAQLMAANADEPNWLTERFGLVDRVGQQAEETESHPCSDWDRLRADHPAYRVLQFLDVNTVIKIDPDAVLLEILRRMHASGTLSDAWAAAMAYPNEPNTYGYGTVAHVCAGHGLPQSLQFLVEHGLDLEVRDPHGRSLMDVAKQFGNHRAAMVPVLEALRARQVALSVLDTVQEVCRAR